VSSAGAARVLGTVLAVGLSVVGGTGCADGVSCRSYAAPALRVHILDATGTPVCDAKVVVHDGGFTETLRAIPRDASTPCVYFGPIERRGTYRIEATARGATANATKVKVTADPCHVITREVTLTLTG